jgi:hypothetical protein
VENGASQNGRAPIPARLLGVGVRGARTVTKAAGIDRAVENAAEEAIVAAVESKAVEWAMVRVLEGPVIEEAVEGALESEAIKRAVGIRLEERLPLRRSFKRLGGLGLAVLSFGIGFLGIFGAQRRAWDDRLSGTGVVYDERRPEPAPWSQASRSALPTDSAVVAGSAG